MLELSSTYEPHILHLTSDILERPKTSISLIYISSINILLHIIQTAIITIRDDGLAHILELRKVIHYQAAEEGCSIL